MQAPLGFQYEVLGRVRGRCTYPRPCPDPWDKLFRRDGQRSGGSERPEGPRRPSAKRPEPNIWNNFQVNDTGLLDVAGSPGFSNRRFWEGYIARVPRGASFVTSYQVSVFILQNFTLEIVILSYLLGFRSFV